MNAPTKPQNPHVRRTIFGPAWWATALLALSLWQTSSTAQTPPADPPGGTAHPATPAIAGNTDPEANPAPDGTPGGSDSEPRVHPPSEPTTAVVPNFPDQNPPHDTAPCLCGPLVGNYVAGQVETWWVQADGGPLDLTVTVTTVNTVDPQSTEVRVWDGTNLVARVNASYSAAEAATNGIGWEKPFPLPLGPWAAGKVLRVEATNGGTPLTQTHYWLKLCGAKWMAIDSPSFRSLEEDHAAWRFRVAPGEPLVLDLDNTGMPSPVTNFVWHLIDPAGSVVGRGTNAIAPGPEVNLPTPAAGLWTLEMRPLDGEHYLLDKQTGADRHIYMDWHTSQRGSKRVDISLDGRPAMGFPFEVAMWRRHPVGRGWTNILIDSQLTTNASAHFRRLPNGYYDVAVRPLAPGIGPVPPQLDLILCDHPVTNRFLFTSARPSDGFDFGGRTHRATGGGTVTNRAGMLVVENLPRDGTGGLEIPLTESASRRWVRFEFAPINLRQAGSRLELVESGVRSRATAAGDDGRPDIGVLRRTVLLGGPDGIVAEAVLDAFSPETATLGWVLTGAGGAVGRGETTFKAGSSLRFVGDGDLAAFAALTPTASGARRWVGGGIRFTGPMRVLLDNRELGEGQEFNWFLPITGERPNTDAATQVGVLGTLPGGSFAIRSEAESSAPIPALLRPGRLSGGQDGFTLEFQPEPGLDHIIETTSQPGGPWRALERRAGTFLPEQFQAPFDEGFRLYRVRAEP
ncbi:MAG: hypothetical protein LW626_06350 [Verrucomicrobium sp.]|nr:hypothetical protein [Verrucomicrobium sp.]